MEKNEILKKINNLSRELRPQVLLENETFFDNGLDSLDCLDLILLCEKEFNFNYDFKAKTAPASGEDVVIFKGMKRGQK